MPASPSDGRGKWKRRKREPQITRKQHPKLEDPDDEDEDDAFEEDNNNNDHLDDDSEGPNPNPNLPQSAALPDPNHLETEVFADSGVRICDFPSVTKLAVNRPHESVFAVVTLERANLIGESSGSSRGPVPNLENVSYGQLQAVSAVPAEGLGSDQERNDGGNSAYVVTPPPIMEGKGVVKRFGNRVHVVPMHSDWFSPAMVNRLERQVVPHFFSGKSPDHTPEKYMECRNYVVAKYMENPEKRITVSDCQGLVAGIENEDLARTVRFLDHWGIINYCAAPPSCESWNGGSYLREDPNGEVHVPSAALKSIDSLIKFDKPKCRLKAADVYSSLSCHDDEFSDLDNKIRERLSENRCTYCSQPLPGVYHQSQKEIDVLLCSDCFHEGRFVTNHSSLDFIKMDPTKDYGDLDGESWSDQETLLLLEAMEVYNENWNEIAEHVGTKSKSQCILHFLRLPMEDGLLENIEVPSMSKSPNLSSRDDHGRIHMRSNGDLPGSCLQDADAESRIPFANSGNPVMSLVAFLASAVGPRVAAACAHASLAALSEDNRVNLERLHGREGNFHGEVANSNQQKDNLRGSLGPSEAEGVPLSEEKVKAAAKAGLAAAATKAKLFADHEEREIQRLSANIINHQLKRLELKLKQFAEVETFLMRECEQVEKTRQRFAAERARILSSRIGPAGATSQMNLAGVSPSMVNNNIGSSRQQVMPTSSSQPTVSGYGNNQQIHPHMSFMQRGQPQPMFPLGPRLPLAAIQPSSSAPSNVMFNPPGNSQPSLNQMLRSVSGPSSGLG
ncbi:SWI/SNF complex subunit SWI3C isoform X2 [Hevea brasiliensis]|uniref:SWI/SNF complex subunit SWI3C isoform X2 n=1 Tax=Hevea brasiliensis TaxID=3981 RepID=UPI0025DEBB45|nr:SWI/SNF complex subunit SWI3C isoform X2 [Hevea brasiliensis]